MILKELSRRSAKTSTPKEGIFEVTVPSMKFIAVDGNGPLTGENIQKTMYAVFNLAYGIKICRMHGVRPGDTTNTP